MKEPESTLIGTRSSRTLETGTHKKTQIAGSVPATCPKPYPKPESLNPKTLNPKP